MIISPLPLVSDSLWDMAVEYYSRGRFLVGKPDGDGMPGNLIEEEGKRKLGN